MFVLPREINDYIITLLYPTALAPLLCTSKYYAGNKILKRRLDYLKFFHEYILPKEYFDVPEFCFVQIYYGTENLESKLYYIKKIINAITHECIVNFRCDLVFDHCDLELSDMTLNYFGTNSDYHLMSIEAELTQNAIYIIFSSTAFIGNLSKLTIFIHDDYFIVISTEKCINIERYLRLDIDISLHDYQSDEPEHGSPIFYLDTDRTIYSDDDIDYYINNPHEMDIQNDLFTINPPLYSEDSEDSDDIYYGYYGNHYAIEVDFMGNFDINEAYNAIQNESNIMDYLDSNFEQPFVIYFTDKPDIDDLSRLYILLNADRHHLFGPNYDHLAFGNLCYNGESILNWS